MGRSLPAYRMAPKQIIAYYFIAPPIILWASPLALALALAL